MIVDAFLFYNELNIVELRLETLKDKVDWFVLVRGDRTHRGDLIDSPDLDEAVLALTKHFNLHACTVILPPDVPSPWDREHIQRDAMADAIQVSLAPPPETTVLLSDADEIPDPARLDEAVRITRRGEVACFQQVHSYFALNLVDEEVWYGSRAISWGQLCHTTAQALRDVSNPGNQTVVTNGGWHFGWTGGNAEIRKKLKAFAHEELDRPDLMSDDRLNACLEQKITLHNGHNLFPVDIAWMPKHVRENRAKYEAMLVPTDRVSGGA